MSLLAKLKQDQLQSRKNRDAMKSSLLTTLIGEASMPGKNDGNRESTDAEVTAVIKKFIKNASETQAALEKSLADGASGLEDSLSTVRAEISTLTEYLPSQLTKEQITDLLKNQIASGALVKDAKMKGAAMKFLKTTVDGQYDGKVAAQAIDDILNS